MDDTAIILKRTFEAYELAKHDSLAIALEELFRDHHIEDARFIGD
jgi:hypothetical protein